MARAIARRQPPALRFDHKIRPDEHETSRKSRTIRRRRRDAKLEFPAERSPACARHLRLRGARAASVQRREPVRRPPRTARAREHAGVCAGAGARRCRGGLPADATGEGLRDRPRLDLSGRGRQRPDPVRRHLAAHRHLSDPDQRRLDGRARAAGGRLARLHHDRIDPGHAVPEHHLRDRRSGHGVRADHADALGRRADPDGSAQHAARRLLRRPARVGRVHRRRWPHLHGGRSGHLGRVPVHAVGAGRRPASAHWSPTARAASTRRARARATARRRSTCTSPSASDRRATSRAPYS